MWKNLKNFIVEILFPKFCLNCQKEGDYLCQDCQSLLEVVNFHQDYSTENLKDLYYALSLQNPLVKKLIKKFRSEPFIKELAKTLSSLILAHFQLIEKPFSFPDFVLVPIPLEKKRMKWQGFSQAEEIGKELAKLLNIPLISDCLVRVKESIPQAELQIKENTRGVFQIEKEGLIKDRKILLINDVYTTGSIMEEAARVLGEAGTKEIIGIVAARG